MVCIGIQKEVMGELWLNLRENVSKLRCKQRTYRTKGNTETVANQGNLCLYSKGCKNLREER